MQASNDYEGYLTLAEMVSAVSYNNCLVILKQKTDEFVFLDSIQSTFVRSVWARNVSTFSADEISAFKEMQLIGLVHPQLSPSASVLLEDEKVSVGLADTRWSQSDVGISFRTFRPLYFFKALSTINAIRKIPEKHRLPKILGNLSAKSLLSHVDNERELNIIARNVNLAIKLSTKEVQCLEFAYAVCMIAFESGVFCNFRIGVQTHPFMSHAWVESKDRVIMDRVELPSELAIIVSIGGFRNE
ncbi:lasso peptide biosynthesis B2 protein [Pseudomonas putida]|uniref:lasso peptide biosynthesis B2 protein n=1 Tax=Pseudomonas putida TaxID=303 RepID=UPI00125FFCDF|nr:lasso peptide biosynthesis B2 protein [Pseudomonas putida]KAB5627009.1 lasso peptide biosynthesis B2 protein [Pseudomonas putida]